MSEGDGAGLSRRGVLALSSAAMLGGIAGKGRAAGKPGLAAAVPADLADAIGKRRAGILESMARHDVPGVAVALIRDGQVAWAEGFGVTDRASGRPVGTETLFSIQSISKNFTATAILLAVQKGLLDLDAPITRYVPEFRVNSRFEAAPERRMTLRLLLSHRAGFTHEAPIGNNYDPAFPSFEAHVRSISETWLRYPVGRQYAYSNLGFDLAGHILQKASGMPFAQAVKTLLLDPLGMTSTTFSDRVYTAARDRALGHAAGYDAVPLVTPLIPSGGVYTNAGDMAAYARFHLGKGMVGGSALLDRALWETMHRPQYDEHYGLGVSRRKLRFGDTIVDCCNHNGGGFGFGAKFSFYPDEGLAWVAMFNRPDGPVYEEFGEALAETLLARRHGRRGPVAAPASLNPVALPKARLEPHAGRYVARGGQMVSFALNGDRLEVKRAGETGKVEFLSAAQGFMVRDGEADMLRFDAGRIEWPHGPSDLDYNDGPRDMPGPDRPGWTKYTGRYRVTIWGRPSGERNVHIRNGYLYVDELRMVTEFRPGLFFSADGEALDFRGAVATFANVKLQRAQGLVVGSRNDGRVTPAA